MALVLRIERMREYEEILHSLERPFQSVVFASSEPLFLNIAMLSLQGQARLLKQESCAF